MRLFLAIAVSVTLAMFVGPSVAVAASSLYEQVLYDQFDGGSASYAPSNQFISGQEQFNSEIADDFSIPQAEVWTVTEVEVAGHHTGAFCCPEPYANVRLYANAGQLPGPVLVDRPRTSTCCEPDFLALLYGSNTKGPTLVPGRYWLSFQQTNASTSMGSTYGWSWQTREIQSGDPASVRNSACPSWGPRAACQMDAPQPDQIFRVLGWKAAEITLGKPIRKSNGTARIPASSAVPGAVVIQDGRAAQGASLSGQARRRIKRKSLGLPGGSVIDTPKTLLPVKPTARTQKRLDRGRKVRLTVRVTFTPDGGTAYSQAIRVTLRKKLRR